VPFHVTCVYSFAEYYNPANEEFGVLRVLNDDLVKVWSVKVDVL
jgi:hypothetical protein